MEKALATVQKLARFFKKCDTVRKEIKAVCAELDYPDSNLNSLRPMCPTRWLCRLKPIQSTVENYHLLIKAFSGIVSSKKLSTVKSRDKAKEILDNLVKADTYLGLLLLQKPLALLEQFSITLQSENVDFDSVEHSVKTVQKLVLEYRDSEFEKHFAAATALPDSALDNITIKPLKLPRQRTVPARYGGGNCRPSSDIEQHYRIQYYSFVDRITREVTERFSTESVESDLVIYKGLADIIKTGKVMDKELVRRYPNWTCFCCQAKLLHLRTEQKLHLYMRRKSVIEICLG